MSSIHNTSSALWSTKWHCVICSKLYFKFMNTFLPVNTERYLDKVIQGSPTSITKYPVLAQLLLDAWGSQEYLQHCAGIILTSRHVMSAAHCFQYNENTKRK